ncbi:3-hydroxyacyl-CoA dehydrogenase NAD-binding domain-containing protein [Pseudomonas vancouverensis]|uniref:3-hydroxyacyl-CoA dehydrogenase n=1 Tax=Pseudomonas vancouverensis TaxID=95300 RepID=A0A1H2MG90_PSEVA|nr:3-hydroxyacyl-CoA dehydrogenase NAD-binding domain-containing protein [Pseudomonas vancouverensis]KAB0499149.1 3-hydroxyacyl-CoA dehydrogenase [Pseudomonas vancouverensis]TDB59869.1 3-hydroxyacyl-CoA dehydrogenase [Pseudomonas vancouverensis]SDU91506.1 short chain enoyl-CoA hydratase /3-hydroxyacyl-CoA dehydrogenase [Pseudomonas vancouverensis]
MNAPYELRDDGVAVIRMENPPVNSLALKLRKALFKALCAAQDDSRVLALVVTGSGEGFSAGGDLVEFESNKTFAAPELSIMLIGCIETSSKPIVAAMHGFALGGGLELALACHGRVADPACKVGLPETTLGLLPGAGGTQRLPRAIGLEPATNLIINGTVLAASALAESSLFDALSETTVERACQLALELVARGAPWPLLRHQPVHHSHPEGFLAFARQQAKSRRYSNSAIPLALDALRLSVGVDFDSAVAQEQALFRRQLVDPVSMGIRHAFLAERLAPKSDVDLNGGTQPIDEVIVIGAGFMGKGIASCFVRAGYRVKLYDSVQDTARRAVGDLVVQLGCSAAQLTAIDNYASMATADLVVEAAAERLDVKQSIFAELGRHCKNEAILASNTSSLDLDQIALASGRPQRVLGLHFFGPAQVMRLLEVVRGAETDPGVLATALVVAKQLRKVAVIARVCRGFIGNRLFDRYLLQALALVNEGVSPYRIDQVLERWGMRMGPFKVMDLVGIDLLHGAWQGVYRPLDIQLLGQLCRAERTGLRGGRGWYCYDRGSKAQLDPGVAQVITVADPACQVGDAMIAERCLLALVNEGARVLEEGIAQRASDIDVVFVLGYGFPADRGGPMYWASTQGLARIERTLRQWAVDSENDFWRPSALLSDLARDFKDFSHFPNQH